MYNGLSGHRTGLLFLVAVIVVFTQSGLWAGRRRNTNFPDNSLISSASNLIPFGRSNGRPMLKEHPIPKLMAEAEAKFRNILSRQSKSLEEAVAEYQRRYGRSPPQGFEDWWQFAKDNDVVMIDEYDSIAEDLAPFWPLSGAELRQRAALVSTFSSP